MIARAWNAAKACGRFCWRCFEWYMGLCICLGGVLWGAAWAVGSFRAGRFLDLNEVLELLNRCATRLGLN